eukprot:TRINITY_DN17858_c0_g1_i1.p1 TRINITY_DN17858_c0_g1~~TRINITY_DN17858_c0_g1_i1.p1  ORF type:complete len:130 (-),score=15.99 TRINITY_DN17858_c0_g1_i1:119-508(-)
MPFHGLVPRSTFDFCEPSTTTSIPGMLDDEFDGFKITSDFSPPNCMNHHLTHDSVASPDDTKTDASESLSRLGGSTFGSFDQNVGERVSEIVGKRVNIGEDNLVPGKTLLSRLRSCCSFIRQSIFPRCR